MSEPEAVEILYCPHHRVYAVSIGDLRITPRKCCGFWTVVASWPKERCNMSEALTEALRFLIARVTVLEGILVARGLVTPTDLTTFRVAQLAQDDQATAGSR